MPCTPPFTTQAVQQGCYRVTQAYPHSSTTYPSEYYSTYFFTFKCPLPLTGLTHLTPPLGHAAGTSLLWRKQA